jgi:hypothetical protein
MILTFKARNVPSQFNETSYMAAAIYNVAVLFMFVVPIVASSLGGRETAYQIRSFGIIVLVVSTLSILFLPKFYLMLNHHGGSDTMTHLTKGDKVTPTGTAIPVSHVRNKTAASRIYICCC